jgi:3',5'-cyclic AMP phosphodiesterase CpdA
MLIVQITDFHVDLRVEISGTDIDTEVCLVRAVEHLNRFSPAPDLVVATGDLANRGSPEEYERIRSTLSGLSMRYLLLPGNHDDRDNLRSVFSDHDYLPREGEFLHYVLDEEPLRIIALDTLNPGFDGGLVCEKRCDWFEARLGEAPHTPTLVFMHHPPTALGIPNFDAMACARGEAVGKIISRNPQVQLVACGHVHRPIAMVWNGALLTVAPSIAFQYPLDFSGAERLAPVIEPPGCRFFQWSDKGELTTHLSYLKPDDR